MWREHQPDQAAGCARRSVGLQSDPEVALGAALPMAHGIDRRLFRARDGARASAQAAVPLGHDIYEVATSSSARIRPRRRFIYRPMTTRVVARWRALWPRSRTEAHHRSARMALRRRCYEQIGAAAPRRHDPRRRIAAMLKHRPRFLTRREGESCRPTSASFCARTDITAPD